MRSSRSRRPPHLLYAGAALFLILAALTVLSLRREWHRRVGEEQAALLFRLVQDKTPPRPTETPGVSAWLHLALKSHRGRIADPEQARLYGEIADWQDRRSVPPCLAVIRDQLARPVEIPEPYPLARWASAGALGSEAGARSALQFREQRFAELDGFWLVVTRRKAVDAGASDRFLQRVAPRLLRLGERVSSALASRPLPPVPGPTPPRVARVYALSEDGTLVSLPLGELTNDPAVRRRAVADEGREFRKLPQLPNFVSNEFFFQFDFTQPAGQVYYSGLYLDLGGQGVVATITVPYADAVSGPAGILGADITFDFDWRSFAREIEPPMVADVVTLPPPAEERWRPWNDVLAALPSRPAEGHGSLVRAVTSAADRERREGLFVTPGTVQHTVVEGLGAVAALRVSARDWLVILFPKTDAGFPVLSLALLLLPMLLLLGGFEVYRRRVRKEKVHGARGEERRRLAGLLSHGIDTLVRVLAHALVRSGETPEDRAFVAWLAAYVERRVRVTAWLLDHWDAEPPFPPACAIEASHARETIAALERVFARAAADAEVRSSLHWDNGVLSRQAPHPPGPPLPSPPNLRERGEADPLISLVFDWPSRYWFPMPVRGGFGLFLEEALVNAIRHGRPGCAPRLSLHVDRGRKELLFEVENEISDGESAGERIEPYGGRRILERLAELFVWQGLAFERRGATWQVSWRVPLSEREAFDEAD